MTIAPKFIERVPASLEEGIIYISISVNTAVHLCPCGCKTEIVTPLDPLEWSFTYDGESISLDPSIGAWGAQCKSHYWIIKNQVKWSRKYSEKEIENVRLNERLEFSRQGFTEVKNSDMSKKDKPWWKFW